jgi:hypothetical protein
MSQQSQTGARSRTTLQGSCLPGTKIPGRQTPRTSFQNQSVIRAFAILKAFCSPQEWVGASALSRRAGIHEATVNRFLQSLIDVGAVVRNAAGQYRCLLSVLPRGAGGLPENMPLTYK